MTEWGVPPPPPPSATISVIDSECYVNYWLCMFDTGEIFELGNGLPLDTNGLRCALAAYRLITFNGNHYDMPIIALALAGADNATLKQASDMIIVGQLQPWELLRHFNVEPIEWIDHIDLFDVAPGQASLKMYGAKMHSRRLQDLPYAPTEIIDEPKRLALREYCANDLRTTRDLFETFPTQLALREQMTAEYGVDVRSKSDAQIAEAVMKSLLPFKVERPVIPAGGQFYYRPPEWLRFIEQPLLELLARSPMTINTSGSVDMTAELEKTVIRIGDTSYHMGIGGLHSMESGIVHRSDATYILTDHDVASYYPSLILRTGIYPRQIGEAFVAIYRGWYDRRMVAKRAGDKKTANSLKTLLNGTFGKLLSKWSIFYAPSEGIQVTLTGQLALLMLIELLELSGISVISANTDGIVIKCRRDMEWARDAIIHWWESVTEFETERTDYALLASRDINNYVAIRTDGEVKLKGAYAPAEPGASGWPNPTGQICVDAVVAWLRYGTPMEQTIRACTDVRQFVYVRQVKGGGSYCPNGTLPAKATQTAMRTVVGDMPKDMLIAAYSAAVSTRDAKREYLGKAVRWYYATGSKGCIVTPTGGLVARTDGCRPLMELPNTLPGDVDYEWYVREARGLLADLGVMQCST